jgi:hypothetical protein
MKRMTPLKDVNFKAKTAKYHVLMIFRKHILENKPSIIRNLYQFIKDKNEIFAPKSLFPE